MAENIVWAQLESGIKKCPHGIYTTIKVNIFFNFNQILQHNLKSPFFW